MKNDCNVDTKKMYSKVEDFLKDDDFIKYVLDDAPESAFHWDKLLKEHAELLKVFEEAKNVLLVSDEAMEVMTLSEERKLKHRIFTTSSNPQLSSSASFLRLNVLSSLN